MDAPRHSRAGNRGGDREGFPRGRRLRRRSDFLAVQDAAGEGGGGRRISGPNYLVLARRRPILSEAVPAAIGTRLGVTVSRKVGNAVKRNRVKRWVRESYRRMSVSMPAGTDLVVIARAGAASSSFRSTSAELGSLLRRLRP